MIRAGILSVPEHDEESIKVVTELLHSALESLAIVEISSAASQRHWIEEILRRWCDEEEYDLVITIGATFPAAGPGPHEIIPEATIAIVERMLPGIPETMRACAQEETHLAMLDRSVAGIRGRSLIINLPEGAAAALLFLESVVETIEPIIAHLYGESRAPRLSDVLELTEPTLDPHQEISQTSTQLTENKSGPSLHIESKLDPAEFADFLSRRSSRSGDV
ncbi:hypothetical protein KFU94_11375 [Chloroflexi bacterium TSY]|nr:hypothetical protein [Chloroflexi bacterium TSY]